VSRWLCVIPLPNDLRKRRLAQRSMSLVCNQQVAGSSPVSSTISKATGLSRTRRATSTSVSCCAPMARESPGDRPIGHRLRAGKRISLTVPREQTSRPVQNQILFVGLFAVSERKCLEIASALEPELCPFLRGENPACGAHDRMKRRVEDARCHPHSPPGSAIGRFRFHIGDR
jgi:hypothetical protein